MAYTILYFVENLYSLRMVLVAKQLIEKMTHN